MKKVFTVPSSRSKLIIKNERHATDKLMGLFKQAPLGTAVSLSSTNIRLPETSRDSFYISFRYFSLIKPESDSEITPRRKNFRLICAGVAINYAAPLYRFWCSYIYVFVFNIKKHRTIAIRIASSLIMLELFRLELKTMVSLSSENIASRFTSLR